MRILILASCATAERTFAADEECELDDAVAHELIRAGLAQSVTLPFAAEPTDTDEVAAVEASPTDAPAPRRHGRSRRRA